MFLQQSVISTAFARGVFFPKKWQKGVDKAPAPWYDCKAGTSDSRV
jgi:hypothetical protein